MKRTSKEDELLVQGYELLHYDTNTSIALPLDVAKTSRKELLSRQQAANEARRLEIQRDQEARAAKSAETREDKPNPRPMLRRCGSRWNVGPSRAGTEFCRSSD